MVVSSCTIDTEYSACSTEFAPFDSSLVVCGTYQIVRDEAAVVVDESSPPTKRLGRCLLYEVDDEVQLCV
jgi:diphthamide biosynthesis protein 7